MIASLTREEIEAQHASAAASLYVSWLEAGTVKIDSPADGSKVKTLRNETYLESAGALRIRYWKLLALDREIVFLNHRHRTITPKSSKCDAI